MALAAAAMAAVLTSASPGGGGTPSLADARAQEFSASEALMFQERLDQARILVDGNRDAGPALELLTGQYPGRHEVWLLAARYAQASGRAQDAVLSYARAVRLEPDYLDHGSPVYLGDRISRLVEARLAALREIKQAGALDQSAVAELRAAYFLARRLAGGCE